MATEHYNLPTINGADPVSLVDTINGLANAADVALYAVDQHSASLDSTVTEAASTAESASAAASAASTNVTAAQQTAAAAQQTATSAQQAAIAANQIATQASATADDAIQITNLSNIRTATSLGNFTQVALTLMQNSDGSLFKFFGGFVSESSVTSSVSRVAIPGGRGDFAYGAATGLFLTKHPDSAYIVTHSALQLNWGASTATTFSSFAVGTDGQIYAFPYARNEAMNIANTVGSRFIYWPCIYCNFKVE